MRRLHTLLITLGSIVFLSSVSNAAPRPQARPVDARIPGPNFVDPAYLPYDELTPDARRSTVISAFESFPDPTEWSVDARGLTRFRLTTAQERRSNGWPAGSFLVEAPRVREHIARGEPSIELLIPLVEEPENTQRPEPVSQSVQLALQETWSGASFIEREASHGKLETRSLRPTFFSWWTAEPAKGGQVFVLRASDLGGLSLKGYVGGFGIDAGLVPSASLLTSLPAVGGPPNEEDLVLVQQQYPGAPAALDQCFDGECAWLCADLGGVQDDGSVCGENDNLDPPIHACNDGIDNDGDGTTDQGDGECKHHDDHGCDDYAPGHKHTVEYGKYIAYMGEGMWCHRANQDNDGAWYLPAFALAKETAAFYGALGPNPALWNHKHLRLAGAGCWLFESFGDAYDCTIDDDCPQGYGEYPYDGAGDWAWSYISNAWDDLRHAVSHSGLDSPVSLVQVLYYANGADLKLKYAKDGGVAEACGVALGSGSDKASITDATTLVTNADITACGLEPELTSAHEFGHTLGLSHQNDGNSFMASDGGNGAPTLSSDRMDELESCLSDWECPRPSGY